MTSRRRRLLLGASLLALAAAAAFLAALPLGLGRDPVQECYSRIRVGEPYQVAKDTLAEYGFHLDGGGVDAGAAFMTFRRAGGGQAICLSVGFDGVVSYKSLEEQPPDTFLGRLRRLLPWLD
jgi:hypothetical protein